jgi:hypothetical protein
VFLRASNRACSCLIFKVERVLSSFFMELSVFCGRFSVFAFLPCLVLVVVWGSLLEGVVSKSPQRALGCGMVVLWILFDP